jgi:two-component system chemotaxis response regulator CheB
MQSAAQTYKNKVIGVILTGMGKDGAEGMKAIFSEGGYTIAQDESTSVVFGMPKAVIDMKVAKKTVPLHDIPSFVIGCL